MDSEAGDLLEEDAGHSCKMTNPCIDSHHWSQPHHASRHPRNCNQLRPITRSFIYTLHPPSLQVKKLPVYCALTSHRRLQTVFSTLQVSHQHHQTGRHPSRIHQPSVLVKRQSHGSHQADFRLPCHWRWQRWPCVRPPRRRHIQGQGWHHREWPSGWHLRECWVLSPASYCAI